MRSRGLLEVAGYRSSGLGVTGRAESLAVEFVAPGWDSGGQHSHTLAVPFFNAFWPTPIGNGRKRTPAPTNETKTFGDIGSFAPSRTPAFIVSY